MPTRSIDAEPLTSVVTMTMAMTSQAIPSTAIGYFVTCFDAVDEIVTPARGLGPGDPLAPALLLAGLLLEALLLQPLQALDALDRRRLLLRSAPSPGTVLTSVESPTMK